MSEMLSIYHECLHSDMTVICLYMAYGLVLNTPVYGVVVFPDVD